MKNIIIAIDGPSASGKGTLAKKIAKYYNFKYLNTGALYRLVAYKMLRDNIINLEKNIDKLVENIDKEDFEDKRIFLEEIGVKASEIAKEQILRDKLFDFQVNFVKNAISNKDGVVIEGRDTTTKICPDAHLKFFITASPEVRAKRRFEELKEQNIKYEEILNQTKERDFNDFNRKINPLQIVKDANFIDNSELSIEESFDKMKRIIDLKIKEINS